MLIRALIPLHKNRGLGVYHAQLTYCMTLYVAKEPALMVPILGGILKYWPYGSSSKEMLFLNEVEEVRRRGGGCVCACVCVWVGAVQGGCVCVCVCACVRVWVRVRQRSLPV